MANTQPKRRTVKSFDNQFLSGPDYDRERPGKYQKTTHEPQHHQQITSVAKGTPRSYTVSLAIPSSIIDGAPTLEMKTILAGQIARSLVIFNVDEIVIYQDKIQKAHHKVDPNLFLARVFQYMETPQYLRKALVPLSPDLKFAGLLPPLDVPHHPGMHEQTRYREGVTLMSNKEDGTLVDVGLFRRVRIDKAIQPGVRVTVELAPIAAMETRKGQKPLPAKVVSPKTPREKMGLYWGYSIRLASSISRVMTESPYEDGYDYMVGVSDRSAKDMYGVSGPKEFSHLLVAFGGPMGGLQEAIEADEDLKVAGEDAAEMFDMFIDPNAQSGTRAVRLEESITMVMSVLKPTIIKVGKRD
ncbi:putative RNA methyltransferase [Phycomyces nitens]|nr:putative RNA methyltransferase [Phycomyces nitens]